MMGAARRHVGGQQAIITGRSQYQPQPGPRRPSQAATPIANSSDGVPSNSICNGARDGVSVVTVH